MIHRFKGLIAVVVLGGSTLVAVAACSGTVPAAGNSPASTFKTQSGTTRSSTAHAVSTATASPTPKGTGVVVHENMTIETGKMLHKPGWPKFTHAAWTARAGDTVVLSIKSFDDGTAPLLGDSPYGRVLGTVGGTEQVDGKPVKSIADKLVAHTLTAPELGLNIVIPAAPKGGTVTVQATFRVPTAGTYDWQCEAPCGTTASGWGGSMETPGWMQGHITIAA